jgi:hypothetical protein
MYINTEVHEANDKETRVQELCKNAAKNDAMQWVYQMVQTQWKSKNAFALAAMVYTF